MTKKDEEKTAFHTKEGVFCYMILPLVLECGGEISEVVDYAFKEQIRWTEAAEAAFLEMKKMVYELPTLTTLKKGKTLMMYLAASNEEANAVLLTERDGSPSSRGQTVKEVFPSSPNQGAYGITYVPRVAVKGQVLADTSTKINATPEVASTPRMEDILESSNARKNLTPGPRACRLYADGASNNGGSGVGLILIAPDDMEYSYAFRLNFSNSNNDAEYEALLAGLRIATEMQVKDIHAFVDSKLVASQVEGSYEAKAENRKADALSKLAAVQFDHLSKEVLVEVLNERSIEVQEVNMVVEEEGPTWMTPIRNYLEKGILPEDLVDARTLMEKIRNYTMEMEMHDGPRQVVAKAMNLGYYWPSMHRDARELIRACDDCQAHASLPRLPKADMISVTSAWPFIKWGMDIVGPLPKNPGRVKYLIVETDYFTKWIEAKPLATITGKQVVNFTWDNIVCRFGIPTTIITENGTQFVNDPFKKWAEKLMIQLISTSAHRTMKKTSNGETPFSLTYGTEAVIPTEIGMPTHRTSNLNEKTNDQELRLNLDLLEERREIAAIREARYKQHVEKYYNKKVRHVQFQVGEFVLRKNEASRAVNTGKLGPTWEGPYKVIHAFQSGAYKLSNMEGEEIPRTWHACNLRRHMGLEVGSIRRIQGLDTAYWGFLGVGTTLDIFQNIIFIPYFQYGVLVFSGYGVLSFIPLWSLVSAGTDTPYLP
ncbi:reverse transcriptase domain-containing protein [Tanacetum coccineum]|uniref:Reverse transcriptase domain-containing protein n=1 Tax=Tanacetum coccineum TaxID=301880 RepID=A0ABQ4WZ97_9ASTR